MKLLAIFIIIYVMCAIWVGNDYKCRQMNPTDAHMSAIEVGRSLEPIKGHVLVSTEEIGDSKAHTGVK